MKEDERKAKRQKYASNKRVAATKSSIVAINGNVEGAAFAVAKIISRDVDMCKVGHYFLIFLSIILLMMDKKVIFMITGLLQEN